ncbi:MAG TPA: hypothetical protein DEP84_14305 [Chloroflexi bacterium]|nr:hypothetical protein [Chloroflexota bacterium]
MDILGKAVFVNTGSHVVEVANQIGRPIRVRKTVDIQPASGVRVAQTTTPELARWLATAINQTLDGEEVDPARPQGRILSRGHFDVDGPQVSAWSRHRKGVVLAQCPDPDTARRLADALEELLMNP